MKGNMTVSFQSLIKKHSISLIIWPLLCVGLYLTSLYSYILFHIVAESFSIVIAFSLFMIAWNTRHLTKNNYVLFISIAFLFAGLIDFVHTLAYKGMGIFIGYDANLPTQLWIIARYLQSISFLVAPWFIDRKLNPAAVFGFYLSATILLIATVFSGTLFPDCFIEGKGLTPFKIVSEYIICFILICSFVLLISRREKFDPEILRLIALSILCTIISELAFTFYISVYGISNLIGHFFKIFSFYLIYRAIIVTGLENPFSLLFYDLQKSQEKQQIILSDLHKNQEELQIIMDSSPIMIFYKDTENTFIRVNKALAEATGLTKEAMEGKPVFKIYPHQTKDYWDDDKEVIASGKSKLGIIEPIDATTGPGWVQTDKIPYKDKDGRIIGIIGFSVDITERKRMEEKIQHMAYHDSLTGLPNRKLFSDRLGIALAQAQRNKEILGIAMLDLDNFKDVNDTLGHDTGDLLLKEVAERIKAALRKGDTVARFGGDEFVLIIPELKGAEDALQVAQKIADSFHNPFLVGAHQLMVTTSIGIAIYPNDGVEETILLKNADKAMYEVKQTGRDRCQIYKQV